MTRFMFVFFAVIISPSSVVAAEIYNSYDPYYGEKRLVEYVSRFNTTPFAKDKILPHLKSYYTSKSDRRYLELENKSFTKTYKPALIYKNQQVVVNIDGRKVATISAIDPVTHSVKINGQDISLPPDKTIMKVHQEFQSALNIPGHSGQAQLAQISLLTLVPLSLDFIGLSFEAAMAQLVATICAKPHLNYSSRNPFESHWLRRLKDVLVPNQKVVRTCGYWAQLQVAKGNSQNAERLKVLCTQGRRAMSCVKNSGATPFGIKKSK